MLLLRLKARGIAETLPVVWRGSGARFEKDPLGFWVWGGQGVVWETLQEAYHTGLSSSDPGVGPLLPETGPLTAWNPGAFQGLN